MTEKKIKELQEQVAAREKHIVKTEEAATNLGKAIERRETQVKTLQTQLTDLKQKNQANEEKIKGLESQINKLKEEAKEAENKIGGLEAKVLQLTTELTNTKSELDDKRNELEKEQEKSKQLANDLETANKKIDSLWAVYNNKMTPPYPPNPHPVGPAATLTQPCKRRSKKAPARGACRGRTPSGTRCGVASDV